MGSSERNWMPGLSHFLFLADLHPPWATVPELKGLPLMLGKVLGSWKIHMLWLSSQGHRNMP